MFKNYRAEGYSAYEWGQHKTCPYEEGSKEADLWREGYDDAAFSALNKYRRENNDWNDVSTPEREWMSGQEAKEAKREQDWIRRTLII